MQRQLGDKSFPHWATNLRVRELPEVRREVEEDPLLGSWQCDSPEQEDEEHEVGIGG